MRHLKNKVFNQLSIGQQRLALIVRAVLKHPPLVILDEPLEGLDDTNTSLITQLINTLITDHNDPFMFHTELNLVYHRKLS
jgi:molybdate transport system ATP-binding protein